MGLELGYTWWASGPATHNVQLMSLGFHVDDEKLRVLYFVPFHDDPQLNEKFVRKYSCEYNLYYHGMI